MATGLHGRIGNQLVFSQAQFVSSPIQARPFVTPRQVDIFDLWNILQNPDP